MKSWKFASFVEVDKEYRIEGLNIWNFYWHCSDRKVEVRDPNEGQVYYFNEYEIVNDGKKVNFVVGEFSDNTLGLYLKGEPEIK